MSSDINEISDYLPEISPAIEESFKKYYEILEKFNKRISLVSNSSIHLAGRQHFADSYLGIKFFLDDVSNDEIIYDFGSGNGFPGMVFGILAPEKKIVLIERDQKKAQFLLHLAGELGLKNVEVHKGEARGLKDGVIFQGMSRAMAPLPKILLELHKLFKPGGHLYLFKSEHWTSEFNAIPAQLFDIWEVNPKGSYNLPKSDTHRFVIDCIRL